MTGKVAAVSGLLIEARGALSRLSVGSRAEIGRSGGQEALPAEVVGFRDSKALPSIRLSGPARWPPCPAC